jgi:Tol biopolymer transport system component
MLKLLVLAIFLTGCISKKALNIDNDLPTIGRSAPIRALTELGENYNPELSLDGKKLCFITSNHPHHNQAQGYVLHLETKALQRINFQYGDITQILEISPEQYLYTSTTDELKEDSDFIKKTLRSQNAKTEKLGESESPLPRTELYIVNKIRNSIDRLTDHPGFDGFFTFNFKNNFFLYLSQINSSMDLKRYDLKSRKTVLLAKNLLAKDLFFSDALNKIIWVGTEKENSSFSILISTQDLKSTETLLSSSKPYSTPIVSPDGLWLYYAHTLENSDNKELFRTKLDRSCTQRLTYHTGIDEYPRLSPDGARLYFTSNRTGARQIYELDLKSLEPCPTTKTALE